jgi:hypothetical protein
MEISFIALPGKTINQFLHDHNINHSHLTSQDTTRGGAGNFVIWQSVVGQFEGHIPPAAKAALILWAVTARLKPCPFKASSN